MVKKPYCFVTMQN